MSRLTDVVEEVEFLLGTDSPESIAHRLGYSTGDNLARVLYRAERPELALHFNGLKERPSMSAGAPSTIESILTAGEKSSQKRTRNLTAKIRESLDDLSSRIEYEASEADRAAKIAELEAQIAALKGQPVRAKRNTAPKGEHPCGDCDRVFDTGQGLALHRRRTHTLAVAS